MRLTAAAATGAVQIPGPLRDLLLVTVVGWLVLELRQSTNHRPEGVAADHGSRPVIRISSVAGVVLAVVAAKLFGAGAIAHPVVAESVGLVILWCGIAMRAWSFHTLGRYFTFTVQTSHDQPVITDGPYRVLRHPGYAGILLAVTGIGLFIGNWLSLVALVACVTFGIVYRIRIEERALLEAIGEPYRHYAATHKRLVPFVW